MYQHIETSRKHITKIKLTFQQQNGISHSCYARSTIPLDEFFCEFGNPLYANIVEIRFTLSYPVNPSLDNHVNWAIWAIF